MPDHHTFIETYRTFDIMKYVMGHSNTCYYRVFRDGKKFSEIIAGSPKGCRNIIDTYWGYPEEKKTETDFELPNYIPSLTY